MRGIDDYKFNLDEWKGVYLLIEIKDHEEIEPGVLEMMGKAIELAHQLKEPIIGILLAQYASKYVTELETYPLDEIIVYDHDDFRHYNEEIFVPLLLDLINQRKPSIMLFSATEMGRDIAPRLAQDIPTGLTADCTALSIIDHPKFGKNLLGMTRPAFGGNILATIVCPKTRPQMSTVRPGTWARIIPNSKNKPLITNMRYQSQIEKCIIKILEFPTRYNKKCVSLESADIIIAGGRGVGSKENFDLIFRLAELLNAQVGASRAAVFEGYIGEEHLIGQTGKTVRPKVYIAIGISGQIQHISGMNSSDTIIAVNRDPKALIHQIADYSIVTDLKQFLIAIIKIDEKQLNFCD